MLYTIEAHLKKLESEIKDQVGEPMSEEYLETNKLLQENWLNLHEMKCVIKKYGGDSDNGSGECRLTEDEIKTWNDNMMNSDGTKGGHWSEEDTTGLATSLGVCFEHFTAAEWNVTCNMIYSDYAIVARTSGVDGPKFYGAMAKAFLIDMDGGKPCEKLCRYYRHVVKH